MKVVTIEIENCKSYREREDIVLDDRFNILVGPNGGGKSNTLDIITIVLRRFFLAEYTIQHREEPSGLYRDIERATPFQDVQRFLEPNLDRRGDPARISVTLAVGKSDIENLQVLRSNEKVLRDAASRFRHTPFPGLQVLDELAAFEPSAGMRIRFEIIGGTLHDGGNRNEAHFRTYCDSLNYFLLLASEAGLAELKPPFTYFSPYRSASGRDLRANLSGESFRSQLAAYANSSSHEAASLLKLATLYFADLRRSLESRAKAVGYESEWNADPVVKNVSRYLRRLGYEWDVRAVDTHRNIYEIELKRQGRLFSIEQASSGEKEILTFVLGVFALRTSGGLVLIDEPEVHLHPRWQGMLRDLLRDLASDTDNQLILSTHSPVFITPETISHIRRVYQSNDHTTKVVRYVPPAGEKRSDQWHMLNSHNNERVFFADKVVLVEGIQDRVLFDALLRWLIAKFDVREVVEVVEVHGKNNLKTYRELLKGSGIPSAVVADLDYVSELGTPDFEKLFEVQFRAIDKKVLKNKKSGDRETLSEALERAIQTGSTSGIEGIWNYIKGRHIALRKDLTREEWAQLERFLESQANDGLFILRYGEIERYLPAQARSLSGTIQLVEQAALVEWLTSTAATETTKELARVCRSIVGISTADNVAPLAMWALGRS